MRARQGISLLEVIVVIAIIAIMLALLLPAVQRIRELAVRTRSINNVRQIQLALQNYTSKYDGQLPTVDGHKGSPNFARSISVAILPEIEQGAMYHRVFVLNQNQSKNWSLYVPQYVSPADPTATEKIRDRGWTSYAFNFFSFQPGSSLSASFPDGLSNTISIGEHYSSCGSSGFLYTQWNGLLFAGHRATFADGGPCPLLNGLCDGDVSPITSGNPPVARPAFIPVGPRTTTTPLGAILQPITTPFQTAPRVEDCHWMIPQTPHRSGIITGLMDGSVRITAPSVSMETFWGAVTPAGGEMLGNW